MKPASSTHPQRSPAALPGAHATAACRKAGSPAVRAAALVVTALLLSACNKVAPQGSVPLIRAEPPATAPVTSVPDTSVPAAASVLTPGVAPKADAAAGRSNTAMSRTQESNQMPLPGQNYDHSAPLTPAKRASAP